MNSGQEYFGELVVAGCDGPKMLEFVEKPLDKVPFAVESEVAGPRNLTIRFWRDHRGDTALYERADQRIRVISFVGKQCSRLDTGN